MTKSGQAALRVRLAARTRVLREMPCAAIAQAIGEPTPTDAPTMRVKLPKPVAAIYKAVEELEARS